MARFAAVASLLFVLAVPAALADGGTLGATEGGDGVTSATLPVRYVTLPARSDTLLEAVRKSDGRVVRFRRLTGEWGIPAVTWGGAKGGLSADGKLLVLGDARPAAPTRATTRLLVLETKTWSVRQRIELRGDFAFDALDPGARTLYLIQHIDENDLSRYVVRGYDLARKRLLPQAIADRRQKGWTMAGYPVARATSVDGRYVYTLYQQPDNVPFVHALDTVGRSAHCVGIPWPAARRDAVASARLRLADGGRQLMVDSVGADPLGFALDTRTFRIAKGTALAGAGPGAQ